MKKGMPFLLLSLILVFSLFPIPFVKGAWLPGGWDQRVLLSIDSGDIDGALTNFPVLIYISDSSGINNEDITFVFDEVGANSLKIAVTESDGTTECKVEIERWDFGNEKAWLWVKGPSIASGSDTDFYLYYDNEQADNVANVGEIGSVAGESVWDNDYSAVWHMRDKTTSTIWDSTNHDNTATKNVATEPDEVNAQIDKGQDFDGNDITTVNDAPELDIMFNEYWSIEFWVKKDGCTSTESILSKSRDTGLQRWHVYLQGTSPTSNNYIKMDIYDDNSQANNLASTGPLADSTWYHVLYSGRNQHEVICYLNGAFKSQTAIGGISSFSEVDALRIGVRVHGSTGMYYNGLLDEIRLSSGSSSSARRSAEWAKASFETQIDDLLDWGIEEVGNETPTITSASIPDRDDGDNCYEMESYYSFVAVVNDGDGADDIAKVYLRGTQAGAVRFEVRATTLDGVPSWAIQTGANIIDLDTGSCLWAEAGDQGTATFLIRFEWDFTDEANLEIFVYVEDTSAASAGFTEMQTNYFDVIGRLVTIDLAVDDGRINLGGTATFSGKVKYATTVGGNVASAKYPLDGQFTAVHIHNAVHASQGNDNTIVNGEFSGISFAIPSAIQSNTYHVYLDLVADYSDGDAPDGDTVAVIGDRIRILTLTANVTLLEVFEYAQLRLTAELEFDNHPLGPGDFVEINGTAFAWDAGDARFEADVTSIIVQIETYNLYTDGLEATFVITAGNMNGNSVTLNFTIWPPSDPNLLFGAGFNGSIPYGELHWNHSLQGVSVFEIQNSTDGLSWDYLGQSVTTNYTDTLVVNGTERYYRVRACNQTGGNWFNSSFSDANFETIYFVGAVAGPLAGGGIGLIMLILICSPIIVLLVRGARKR